jgi:hypothetical protein
MPDRKIPTIPTSTAKARAADLRNLTEDARRYTIRDRPAQDALWGVLMRPRDTILRDYRAALATWAASDPAGSGGDMGLLEAVTGGPSGIEALATAQVAKAILGDATAAQAVMDRIEGKAMGRKPDDGEAADARATMVAGIEAVVRAMNTQPGDKAIDVTPQEDGDAKPKP